MSFSYLFCPKCAGKLIIQFVEGRDRQVCSECRFIFYRNPVPAVGVILQKGHQVLLVKRKFDPCAGDWGFPAGFMEWGETPEETALREIKEETNLDIIVTELFGLYTGSNYPGYKILLAIYRGKIVSGELTPGDDADDAQFFNLSKLPDNIAFTTHRDALTKLKSEIGLF